MTELNSKEIREKVLKLSYPLHIAKGIACVIVDCNKYKTDVNLDADENTQKVLEVVNNYFKDFPCDTMFKYDELATKIYSLCFKEEITSLITDYREFAQEFFKVCCISCLSLPELAKIYEFKE